MTNVWVLGANGMLGSKVALEFKSRDTQYAAITRESLGKYELGSTEIGDFEALTSLEKTFGVPTHIFNAIGVVKPRIDEAKKDSVLNAIRGNSILPRNLGSYCERNSVHLIQIATDCVYSGIKGSYLESDLYDPTDVYGKTKSLGEFSSECMSLIRCSIIGRENQNKYSLVEWVASQKLDANINGFTNHNWNGVTTKIFGIIASGLVTNEVAPIGKLHLVPSNKVNKFELVSIIKEELGRDDITVSKFEAQIVIDRTLSTELVELNNRIWEYAGFKTIPTISEMVKLGL